MTEEVLGEHRSVELVPGGAATPVTSDNKRRYIHAVADYKLNCQVRTRAPAPGRLVPRAKSGACSCPLPC